MLRIGTAIGDSGFLLMAGLLGLEEHLAVGIDASIYLFLAVAATLLFLLRLGLQVFFGGLDGDVDVDGDHMDSTGAFTFFSLLSILAFFMGIGWMGLACRISWGMGAATSAVAATGFGLALMLLSSGLMYAVRQMSEEARYDVNTAVGAIAKVYLTIPAKGQGQGQIEVTVSGRRKVMAAVSAGGEIPAFTRVKIMGLADSNTFLVERPS